MDRFEMKITGARWTIHYPEGRTKCGDSQIDTDNADIANTLLAGLEANEGSDVPHGIQRDIDDLNWNLDDDHWKVEQHSSLDTPVATKPIVKRLKSAAWSLHYPEGETKISGKLQKNSAIAKSLFQKLEGSITQLEPRQIQDWITKLNRSSTESAWKLERLTSVVSDGEAPSNPMLPQTQQRSLVSLPTTTPNRIAPQRNRLVGAFIACVHWFHATARWVVRFGAKGATKGFRCPACKKFLVTMVEDTLPKSLLPNNCPSCGVRIHRRCPNCDESFTKLSQFCPKCGKQVYAQASKRLAKQRFRSPETDKFLQRLRRDAEDSGRLIREMLLIFVHRNSVKRAAHIFFELINPINEKNTPRPNAAAIYEQALSEAKLVLDTDALEQTKLLVSSLVTEVVASARKKLDRTLPNWRKFVSHSWIERPEEHAQQVNEQFMGAMSSQISDITEIQQKYQQLSDLYPRYKRILLKGGGWGHVVGAAAQYIPDDFGVIAAVGVVGAMGLRAFEGWRAKSDQEFLQSFDVAVEEFSQGANLFTQKIEAAIVPVVDQFVSEFREQCDAVNIGLERASLKGISIEAIFRALHFADDPVVDDEEKQLVELVISNLREQGMSYQSEQNIREMCGLKDDAADRLA